MTLSDFRINGTERFSAEGMQPQGETKTDPVVFELFQRGECDETTKEISAR